MVVIKTPQMTNIMGLNAPDSAAALAGITKIPAPINPLSTKAVNPKREISLRKFSGFSEIFVMKKTSTVAIGYLE